MNEKQTHLLTILMEKKQMTFRKIWNAKKSDYNRSEDEQKKNP